MGVGPCPVFLYGVMLLISVRTRLHRKLRSLRSDPTPVQIKYRCVRTVPLTRPPLCIPFTMSPLSLAILSSDLFTSAPIVVVSTTRLGPMMKCLVVQFTSLPPGDQPFASHWVRCLVRIPVREPPLPALRYSVTRGEAAHIIGRDFPSRARITIQTLSSKLLVARPTRPCVRLYCRPPTAP
ncbi:hypothetical protein EDD16DRAFT_1842091 [Pisolithus croceorrhizus]|nr:hypothetical protein EDD16DRAFT_1842091 [Pisolithus croceorrhizus]